MSLHVHLTPLGGMAGDMFVAAMLDAMPEMEAQVLDAVRAVLPNQALIEVSPVTKNGIAARTFGVTVGGQIAPVRFGDMMTRIGGAGIAVPVRSKAEELLTSLGEAEAHVHGVDLSQVHFHEIADWDTLADLVAAAVFLTSPRIGSWSLDPLPLGGGMIDTAHGRLAVPAPATARLLHGLEVHDDGILGERVTPTGAAIAQASPRLAARRSGRLGPTGYGAGTRDLPGVANVLIAQLCARDAAPMPGRISVIEFDIDDMTGEEISTAADHLRRAEGVVDVVTWPVTGKKGRMATGFRILADPACADEVATACFTQSSTLGIRIREERRRILPRAPGGTGSLRTKTARRPGGETVKAEADDLAPARSLAARRALARKAEDGT